MARYELRSPDGARYEVEAPDNADQQQVLDYFQKQVGQARPAVDPADRAARRFRNQMTLGLADAPADAFTAAANVALGRTDQDLPGEYRRQRAKTREALSNEDGLNVPDVAADTAGQVVGGIATAPLTMARKGGELMQGGLRVAQSQLERFLGPAAGEVENAITRRQIAKESTKAGAAFGVAGGYGSAADDASLGEAMQHMAEHGAGGAVIGRAIPAVTNAFGDYVTGPIRNFLAQRRAARAEHANRVAGEFQEAGIPEFPPALSNSGVVRGTAETLGENITGGPVRAPAKASIDAIEANVRAELERAGGGRTPAEAGEQTQNFLKDQLVERSTPGPEVAAMNPQQLQDISGIRPSPDYNPPAPRVPREQPREIAPVSPEQHLQEVEAGVQPVAPKAALDIESRFKPPTIEEVELAPEMVDKVRKASSAVSDMQRRIQADNDTIRAIEEPLQQAKEALGYTRIAWSDDVKAFVALRPDGSYQLVAHDGRVLGQHTPEEADFFKRTAAWLRQKPAFQEGIAKRTDELQKAIIERDVVQREMEAFRVSELPKLAAERRAQAVAEAKGASEAEAAVATQKARQEARDRAAPTAIQDAMQKTETARSTELARVTERQVQRQAASDAAHAADLAERRARPVEPFNPDRGPESYPTMFDAAYDAVRAGAPGVQRNPLGRRETDVAAAEGTRATALLEEIAAEARKTGELPGYKGKIFDETGALRQDLMEYLAPRLGPDIAKKLQYYSDRRSRYQTAPDLEGLVRLRTALRRAAEDARKGSGHPGNTRNEDDAMLTRMRGAIDADLRRFAQEAGPEGQQFIRQLDEIDRAYESYINDLRKPLADLFDKMNSVQAISALTKDTQAGGNIDRLKAFYRVVDAKGNRLSATAALLNNMMDDGVPGFLKAWRGLSEDAKALMFRGASKPLGDKLESLARVGGHMEQFTKIAGDDAVDIGKLLRPGNMALALPYYFGLPAVVAGVLTGGVASKLMGSKYFASWLKQFPVEKGPGSPEVLRHIQRLRSYASEALGLNDATTGALEDALTGKARAGPLPGSPKEARQAGEYDFDVRDPGMMISPESRAAGDRRMPDARFPDLPENGQVDADTVDDLQGDALKGARKTVFSGENAKTANTGDLTKAKAMMAAKEDPERIWQETGWYQGKDGAWRSEIDDSKSKIKNLPPMKDLKPYEAAQMNLGQVLDHPDLFAAYPGLAKIPVYIVNGAKIDGDTDERKFKAGDFLAWIPEDGSAVAIAGRASPAALRSTLLHEIDHLVGRPPFEVFDYGAGKYENRAGEVAARNTETRLNMSAEERRASHPVRTQDTPAASVLWSKGAKSVQRKDKRADPFEDVPFANAVVGTAALLAAPGRAVSNAIRDGYDAATRLFERGYNPGQGDTQAVDDAFTAAGLATGGSTAFEREGLLGSGGLGRVRTVWPEDKVARLRAMLRDGDLTRPQIAKELGVTPAQVDSAVKWYDLGERTMTPMSERWTPETKRRLKELWDSGMPEKRIATELELSDRAVRDGVTALRDELGLAPRKISMDERWPQERKELLAEMVKDGKSEQAIADHLGIEKHYVHNAIVTFREELALGPPKKQGPRVTEEGKFAERDRLLGEQAEAAKSGAIDKTIVELWDDGLSSGQIAMEIKQRHGVAIDSKKIYARALRLRAGGLSMPFEGGGEDAR